MTEFLKRHSLRGKTAWITGGKRIGQEIAAALAELGANLVISYRSSKKEADQTVRKVQKFKRKVLLIQADVSDQESVALAVKKIKNKFGKLDILVLLASMFKPVKLEDISDKDWDSNIAAHIKATFWSVQLGLSLMRPGSHIITVADRTSVGKVYPGYLPYIVTKSAIAAMTRALAVELGPRGIFINSIAPGPVLKPDDLSDKEWQEIRTSSIIKYPITDKEAVQEFVDTIIRLCFVRSSGSIYPFDLGHL
ncbi:MAG: SDR family oxidoreductase [Patescibacteria group bacterium]